MKFKQVMKTNLPLSVMRSRSFLNTVVDPLSLIPVVGSLSGFLGSAPAVTWFPNLPTAFPSFPLLSFSLCSRELAQLALDQLNRRHFPGLR